MKRIFLAISYILLSSLCFAQKYTVSNDSIEVAFSIVKNLHGDSVVGIGIELINRGYQSPLLIGSYYRNVPSCFVYTVGNHFIVLFGGMRPGLVEHPVEWTDLIKVSKGDTIRHQYSISQFYDKDLVVSLSDFEKFKKTFIFNYLTGWSKSSIRYSDFQSYRQTLYTDIERN